MKGASAGGVRQLVSTPSDTMLATLQQQKRTLYNSLGFMLLCQLALSQWLQRGKLRRLQPHLGQPSQESRRKQPFGRI